MSLKQSDFNYRLNTMELRSLQKMSTPNGMMFVIAMDQRNSMREILAESNKNQSSISYDDLGNVKTMLVKGLGNFAPAILLDPECALPRVVDQGILQSCVSLVIGLDASGYSLDEETKLRKSKVIDGISARKVKELGGDAGKLLVYMRPDQNQDKYSQELIRNTVDQFNKEGVLLIVEILVYPLHDESDEDFQRIKPELIFSSAKLAVDNGAKVLKLQYPGSGEMCKRITELLNGLPWSILSQGVDHTVFLNQLEIAIKNGAKGAIAGRSLWKDCISLSSSEMVSRLQSLAIPRLNEVINVLTQ
ncbi:MAG: tagatose-bisphosphate aldolase [Brevefilum sp.]|jgi:sulfofructosephosphate aldolase